MKKIKIILLCLVINIVAFSQTKLSNYYLPENFYDHFPLSNDNFSITSGTAIIEDGLTGTDMFCLQKDTIKLKAEFIFNYQIRDSIIFDSLVNFYSSQSHFHINKTDSYFIFDSPLIFYKGKYTLIDSLNNYKYNNQIIIPYLGNLVTVDDDYFYPLDYEVYVLDFKLGEFLPKEYLTYFYNIPKEFKHGYSKGVAISKKRKEAIYWIAIW